MSFIQPEQLFTIINPVLQVGKLILIEGKHSQLCRLSVQGSLQPEPRYVSTVITVPLSLTKMIMSDL